MPTVPPAVLSGLNQPAGQNISAADLLVAAAAGQQAQQIVKAKPKPKGRPR